MKVGTIIIKVFKYFNISVHEVVTVNVQGLWHRVDYIYEGMGYSTSTPGVTA